MVVMLIRPSFQILLRRDRTEKIIYSLTLILQQREIGEVKIFSHGHSAGMCQFECLIFEFYMNMYVCMFKAIAVCVCILEFNLLTIYI